MALCCSFFFFFQAEDGIRDVAVTGVQTCALPIFRHGTDGGTRMTDVLSAILRALSFVLLFQAAGVAIFVALFGRRLASSRGAVRRLGQAAALAAMVLVAGHYALEAARMTGELSGMWDSSLQGIVWHSPSRAALICRLSGLLLITIGFQGASPRWTIVAV